MHWTLAQFDRLDLAGQAAVVLAAGAAAAAGGVAAWLCGAPHAGRAIGGAAFSAIGIGLAAAYARAGCDRRRFFLVAHADALTRWLPCVGTGLAIAGAAFLAVAAVEWVGCCLAGRASGGAEDPDPVSAETVILWVTAAICVPVFGGFLYAEAAAAALLARFDAHFMRVAPMHQRDEGVDGASSAERVPAGAYVARAADGSLFAIGADEF